jgi:hypothetical protein
MMDHGYECRRCGNVPSEDELRMGLCRRCKPDPTPEIVRCDTYKFTHALDLGHVCSNPVRMD